MIIAVNTRFLLKDNLEGIGYFTKEILQRITVQHPEHLFYFLFDRPYAPEFIFAENVTPVILKPAARHPLLWKYWFDVKVAMTLKKIRADVFISFDGFCSLTTSIPQYLFIHDLGFLHHPSAYKKSHTFFYKQYTPAFIKKAKRIATVSRFSKNDIVTQYKTADTKIDIIPNAVKAIFQPVSYEVKTTTKKKYTDGKEYFIYAGAIQPRKNLLNLLKAFSLFKKRQQSNWKLVLAGRLAWKNETFLELLKTYKYKNDVVLTGYVEEGELATLIASAYAFVYPSLFEGFGVPVLEAINCGVPPLTSANTAMQEVGEDAVLYFDPADPVSIADKLMLIYKDEDLRNSLIEAGKGVALKYSWQRSADLAWEGIEELKSQK